MRGWEWGIRNEEWGMRNGGRNPDGFHGLIGNGIYMRCAVLRFNQNKSRRDLHSHSSFSVPFHPEPTLVGHRVYFFDVHPVDLKLSLQL